MFPQKGSLCLSSPSFLEPIFFSVDFTVSTSCFHFDLSLLSQVTALSYLDFPFSRSCDLDGWLCSFSFWQYRLCCPCQLLTLGIEAILFYSAGPVCSRFYAKACEFLQVLSWSVQCSPTPLISRIHFSRTEGVLPCRNSSIHKFLQ